jgi:hypothetical protein
MAEEGKYQTYVKTHKAVAAGVASVIAAVFTYRLGVAGTLIGMELTAVVITLSSAIFKAKLMKASHHIASLPKQAAEPDRTPQFANPSQPGDEPGKGEAAPPVKDSEKGRSVKPEKGKEKEDRY